MTRHTWMIIAATAVVAAYVVGAPMLAIAESRFTREVNTDRSGNDIRVERLPIGTEVDTCEAMCAKTVTCVAYTFVKQSATVPQPVCRIKDQAPFGHQSSCCVSGALKK